MTTLIDITTPIYPGMPLWPGTEDVEIQVVSTVEEKGVNVSRFCLDAHAGSHAEGSLHHFAGGKPASELDLDLLVGPAYVAHLPGVEGIDAAALDAAAIPKGTERLLLRTDNSSLWRQKGRPFQERYAALTADGAKWVVDQSIRLIGVDYLSVGRYHSDGRQTHQTLFSGGVTVVETLNLDGVEPGDYQLICLPMKVEGVEAVPVRAVLRRP